MTALFCWTEGWTWLEIPLWFCLRVEPEVQRDCDMQGGPVTQRAVFLSSVAQLTNFLILFMKSCGDSCQRPNFVFKKAVSKLTHWKKCTEKSKIKLPSCSFYFLCSSWCNISKRVLMYPNLMSLLSKHCINTNHLSTTVKEAKHQKSS